MRKKELNNKNLKSNNENDLVYEIINIYLEECINESQLYLKILDNQVKFYQEQLQFLKIHKPFFFQKKKIEIYNCKVEEYEKKIKNVYLKMNDEVNEMLKIEQAIKI